MCLDCKRKELLKVARSVKMYSKLTGDTKRLNEATEVELVCLNWPDEEFKRMEFVQTGSIQDGTRIRILKGTGCDY